MQITREGWTHIRLNTLLLSNRQRVTGYIESTLLQILHGHRIGGGNLPWYERAFVVITDIRTGAVPAELLIRTTRNGSAF